MSNNGLSPECWGNPTWHFLHSVAMGYPETITSSPEDQLIAQQYKTFFETLEFVLPCEWCKVHYKENLSTLPIDPYLNTRRNLSLWVYKFHNLVNDVTGVSEKDRPSFETVYEKYDLFRAPCDEDSKTCGGGSSKKCNIVIQNIGNSNSYLKNFVSMFPFIALVGLLLYISFGRSSKKIKKKN